MVTFDRDFGELAARGAKKAAGGIMLLRFVPADAAQVTEVVVQLLSRADVVWMNHVSVVTLTHVRQRPL